MVMTLVYAVVLFAVMNPKYCDSCEEQLDELIQS